MNEQKIKFKQTKIGLIPEEWDDGERFEKVIEAFIEKERFLLEKDLCERTIMHKLAEYFQLNFREYNVDCEYNRAWGVNKNNEREYMEKVLDIDSSESDKMSRVFPDIILHKRGLDGDNEENYVVIEIKKKEFAEKRHDDKFPTERDFDRKKLCAYTAQLKYQWGIYLEMNGTKIEVLEFFREGEKI